MLILIVVAAAIALAAFVASYQKQLQAEEAQAQQRSLESLKILSITPHLNATNTSLWANFSFVLASEYINPSGIESITVNGEPVRYFWVEDLSAPGGSPVLYDSANNSDTLTLSPREEVVITINLAASASNPLFSMFDPSFMITTTDYVQMSIYTALQNTFATVFLPPTAIAFVTSLTSYTASGPVQIPVLDATDSFQPGANGTIVSWEWSVTESPSNSSTGCDVGTFEGAEWELVGNSTTAFHFYNATLIVTGSDGLQGETRLPFTSYVEACP